MDSRIVGLFEKMKSKINAINLSHFYPHPELLPKGKGGK